MTFSLEWAKIAMKHLHKKIEPDSQYPHYLISIYEVRHSERTIRKGCICGCHLPTPKTSRNASHIVEEIVIRRSDVTSFLILVAITDTEGSKMYKVRLLSMINRYTLGSLAAFLILICITALLGGSVVQAAPSTQETAYWKDYQDPDYGFSLQYDAANWQPKITVRAPNDPDPQVIAKRVGFFGSRAAVTIDVWEHPEKDLVGWVKRDFNNREMPYDVTEVNAKVAGLPAVAYFEPAEQAPSVLSIVFSDDSHFFRIQYVIGDMGAAKDIYLHMLESFSVESPAAKTEFQFPTNVQDKVTGALPAVTTCCGYSWPGNPFPCDNGNCTWWVYYRQGYVPFTGNAGTWWGQVGYYRDWRKGYTPVTGGIAWWNSAARPPYGHVAQVVSISGANINVSEMTWQGNPCSQEPVYRAYASTNPSGYIYWVGPVLAKTIVSH